jgi:hypothetical protein
MARMRRMRRLVGKGGASDPEAADHYRDHDSAPCKCRAGHREIVTGSIDADQMLALPICAYVSHPGAMLSPWMYSRPRLNEASSSRNDRYAVSGCGAGNAVTTRGGRASAPNAKRSPIWLTGSDVPPS